MQACWNLPSPQPRTGIGTKLPMLCRVAATYAYHLTQAHAFADGNKRVAAAITEAFLETNGSQLIMTEDEIVQLFLDIASGFSTRDHVEKLFRERVSPKS